MDLPDALLAWPRLHIDAAVEDMRDSPNEVAVPLTAAGAGFACIGPPLSPTSPTVSDTQMFRLIHRWPGFWPAVLLPAFLSRAALSRVFPALGSFPRRRRSSGQTVGDLAALVLAVHPGVEQIRRAPSGRSPPGLKAMWLAPRWWTQPRGWTWPASGRRAALADRLSPLAFCWGIPGAMRRR